MRLSRTTPVGGGTEYEVRRELAPASQGLGRRTWLLCRAGRGRRQWCRRVIDHFDPEDLGQVGPVKHLSRGTLFRPREIRTRFRDKILLVHLSQQKQQLGL